MLRRLLLLTLVLGLAALGSGIEARNETACEKDSANSWCGAQWKSWCDHKTWGWWMKLHCPTTCCTFSCCTKTCTGNTTGDTTRNTVDDNSAADTAASASHDDPSAPDYVWEGSFSSTSATATPANDTRRYDGQITWTAFPGRWCKDDEWDNRWKARTKKTLAACKQSCLDTISCMGITHGNGNCVLCASVPFKDKLDERPVEAWATMYSFTSDGCNTQISVTDQTPDSVIDHGHVWNERAVKARTGKAFRDGGTCTSCSPPGFLVLYQLQAKTGMCVVPSYEPVQICSQMGGNYDLADVTAPNFICTKVSTLKTLFKVYRIQNATIASHFKSVAGHHNGAVALCNVWKQTVCRSGKCAVKKEVTCQTVCKHKHDAKVIDVEACDDTKCNGEFGGIACTPVAVMA